jgi:hypothetical protein
VRIGERVPVAPLNAEAFFISGNGVTTLAADNVSLFFGQFRVLFGSLGVELPPPARTIPGLPQESNRVGKPSCDVRASSRRDARIDE